MPPVTALAADRSSCRLDALYRSHRAAVFARCRRILGDGDAAEDAAQETFLRLQRRLPRVPAATDQALRWMYRVAANYCFNQLRDRRRRSHLGDDPALAPASPSPAASLVDRCLVRWMITRVPGRIRPAALLHHVEGRDQMEVARMLGVSRRTVVNRLCEFRQHAIRIIGRY